ncbi:MAG: NADH:flavin oxidoreductase, partial [Lachnospiraceae bacterium]|nr:NADH:flavin oxidoreductase [Lachnospiraceae bacterium]
GRSGMFTEISINNRRIRNRIARSATNDHLGYADGRVSPAQMREYEELATGGVGLIFTGHLCVDADHRADPFQNLVCDDRFLPGLAELAAAAHRGGAVIYGQISHAGPKGVNPVDFNSFDQREIQAVADAFISGAERVARAGFDGVQLHLAHGYLLSQVLDPLQNIRTDEYGGSRENRFRLVREIVAGIRTRCPGLSLAIKINANDSAFGSWDETLLYYVQELQREGVGAVEVSGNNFAEFPREACLYYLREACLVKKQIDIPVILVGGLYSRATMQQALDAGVDMVSLSRSLIAEPDFPVRLQKGEAETSRCLRCNQCFSVFHNMYRRCVLRPEEQQLRDSFG